jgi:hypothetical protein
MADTKESLRKKRLAYLATFCGDGNAPHPMGAEVLLDLRKFAGLDYTNQKPGIVTSQKSGMVDSHATVYRAAVRDVYLRIVGFLSIDEQHLFQEPNHEPEAESKTADT